MTADERAEKLFPRVLSPITGDWEARRPTGAEVCAAIRDAEVAARAAAFREAAETCSAEAERWKTMAGNEAHRAGAIVACERVVAALKHRAGEG